MTNVQKVCNELYALYLYLHQTTYIQTLSSFFCFFFKRRKEWRKISPLVIIILFSILLLRLLVCLSQHIKHTIKCAYSMLAFIDTSSFAEFYAIVDAYCINDCKRRATVCWVYYHHITIVIRSCFCCFCSYIVYFFYDIVFNFIQQQLHFV